MSSKSSYTFCTQVCSVIRWKPAREAAWKELLAHLEDHAAALQEQGVPADEAITQAVEAMGDPYQIDHDLDRCHSPLVPRLSRIFILLALAVLVLSFIIGSKYNSGIFALTGLFPETADLPYDGEGSLEVSGTAVGGGKLAGYTLTPSGQAGLVLASKGETGLEYQLQCLVTITCQPWLPPLAADQADAAWTDDAGGGGAVYFSTYFPYHHADALLGSTAWLRITDPTPGARQFTVTLRSTEEAVTIYITLDEEVPPL